MPAAGRQRAWLCIFLKDENSIHLFSKPCLRQAGQDRSVTAEEYASIYFPMHEYDSAGTNRKICFQLGTQFIEKSQLEWADKILCMESKHQKEIQHLFGKTFHAKITVLNIKDHYAYQDSRLKEILYKN